MRHILFAAVMAGSVIACGSGSGDPTPVPPQSTQQPTSNWQNPGSSQQTPTSNWQAPGGVTSAPAAGPVCPVCGMYTCVTTVSGQSTQTLVITFAASGDPTDMACYAGGIELACGGGLIDSSSGNVVTGSWQHVSGNEFTATDGDASYDCTLSLQPGG